MSQTVQLGDIVKLRKGRKAQEVIATDAGGALPYIQIDEVRGRAPTKYATDPSTVDVSPNDLCIVWDGANAGTVGYGLNGAIGSTVARIRFNESEKWDAAFVGRLLQGKFRELNDQAQARGATIPHVDKSKLEQLNIPRVGLNEQRRIAAILDKADAIRRKRKQALALADDLLKSAYVYTVGYLSDNYESWTPYAVEDLAAKKKGAIRSGPFGSALRHSEFVDEGIAVLGIDNAVQNKFAWGERRFITSSKYEELKRYRVYPGDVIITIMGTTGRSAVVPDDIPEAITTKHLASITCDETKILPEVLSFAIHSDPMVTRQIDAQNKGAIMSGLNLGIIRRLSIRRPPMKAQLLFRDVLRKVEDQTKKYSDANANGEALFASLSQRAFRGEL